MRLDLGFSGLGLLVLIALAFGVGAQFVAGRRAGTRWLWLIAASGWLIGGLVASEVIWGAATVEELQPIVDGLAFDEALLGGLIVGFSTVIVTLLLAGPRSSHGPTSH